MNNRTDRYGFIWKAIQKHGYKYDYRKVSYVNNRTKVCIICHKHGEFYQTPDNHLNKKYGCPKCGVENNKIRLTTPNEAFIEKAEKVHNNKYDYSKVEYVNNRTKVCIICHEHGEFYQIPFNHLKGCGCPKCAPNGVLLTVEDFIDKAKNVHGDKYDYSKVDYKGSKEKVCIICNKIGRNGKIHGEFYQTPTNHLNGHNCPVCKESKLEMKVSLILDEFKINYIKQYSFDFLKNGKGKQTLDFYLPDYNIAIECQGKQHFVPIDFSGNGTEWADKRFKYIKELDDKKIEKCKEHNIKMLYINYFDTDEEINCKIYKLLRNE